MKKDARLYIGNTEVELTEGFDLLYNYNIDDVTDPTAVKNGFSKTLKIVGTPNNNKIFGHYWNVERIVGNGGYNMGVDYNASKKAPFEIYVNNEVYESGYVKLDKVNTVDGLTTYECTLYGDLGNFFINLSVNDNTGDKLKLSDLNYTSVGGQNEFDFTVTASTVNEAWNALKNGTNGKWQHINFMTAYNGVPEDFDANKVIMNLSGTSLRQTSEDNAWRANTPVVIADLPEDMTEWEMRDLRSYFQRPCIRMKSIISACCDPSQNGGYEVELDPDFFNSGNPYYEKTWLTLPLMQNLEYANEEQILSGSNLIGMTTTGDVNTLMYQDLKFDIGEYASSTPSSINVNAQVFVNNTISQFNAEVNPFLGWILSHVSAPYTSFAWWWGKKSNYYHTGWWCLGSLFVQLIAMNGEVVVGASEAYNLTTPIRHNGKLYFGNNKHYSSEHQFKPYLNKQIYDVLGEFHDDGFYEEGASAPKTLGFHIYNLNSPVSQLKMVFYFGATDNKIKHMAQAATFGQIEQNNWIDIGGPEPLEIDYLSAFTQTVGVISTDMKAVLGESLGRTGTQVTKQMLLNTEGTPCDYLLSYAKMFGLYFKKDLNQNKISILTRKTYYNRSNIVNLEDYIDRSKDYRITPVAMDAKWYEFSQEKDESEWQKKYYEAKGIEYGIKVVNTGYEFNVEKKNLLEKNIIRSGIEGLERSKYFSAYDNDAALRTWMGMGLHYKLVIGGESEDVDVPIMITSDALPLNEGQGMKYYDVFPKLQFHDKDGKPTDGNNVLVFFSGFKNVVTGRTNPLNYFLTDDNMYQTLLNDGTPCWLYSPTEAISGNQIAIKVESLPVFERYLTNEGSGKVDKSLDFGTAQELYIPDYSLTDTASVFDNFWRRYIEDICDPDTKILECYVRVDGKINDEWLRRFYWFDNSIWRLNKVVDWNVMDYGTTKMEFIKVTDVDGYTSTTQVPSSRIRLSASKSKVNYGGETISLTVDCDDNFLPWRIVATSGVVLSQTSGVGDTTLSVTFPSNNDGEYKYWYFTADADVATGRLTIMQDYEGSSTFTVIPEHLLVPASGGSKFVNFTWKNQGDDYICDAFSISGEGMSEYSVPLTADITTYRTENKAELTFEANPEDFVRNNICDLYSNNSGDRQVLIDQLPAVVSFDNSGGSQTLIFQPATRDMGGIEVTGLPYWITATLNEDGDEITFTALPNDYGERTGSATISVPNSSADIAFEQEEHVEGPTFFVEPENLYYSNEGGTQYLSLTSDTAWYYKPWSGEWWTISTQNGNGNATLGVTVPQNPTSDVRSGYAEFGTIISGNEVTKRVYVSQGETGQTGITISVSPQTTSIATTGETITYTVTVNNMNGLSLVTNATAGSVSGNVSQVTWSGNVGTLSITYPENLTLNDRAWTVDFVLESGNTSVTSTTINPTQLATGQEYFNVSSSTIQHTGSGQSSTLYPDTNTCWTATTVGSASSPTAIGFETPTWDVKNLIDTGIHPNLNTRIRVKYTGRGELSDRIAGTIEGYQGCDDDHDFRFFDIFASQITVDIMDYRGDGPSGNLSADGVEYDITFGKIGSNITLYDNIAEDYIMTPYSPETWVFESAYTVCVDVGTRWVKEVIIEDSGVVVFSGTPYSNGGVVGLYDSVSNTVKTLYSGSSGTLITSGGGSTPADWITVSPASGCDSDSITITTSPSSGGARTGYVYVYSKSTGTLLKVITVRQGQAETTLVVTPSNITFDSAGGTVTVTITSNTNWTIE